MIYPTIDCHWLKCFCIYRLKCFKVGPGWVGLMGWKSLYMHLCYEHHHSAVLIIFNGDEGMLIWWIHLLNSNK